jgi:hypothetical protein
MSEVMSNNKTNQSNERGAALIMALLTLALLLAMAMGISLTAISELGVSKTYETQTRALQAAEAGLNHAASLVSNYTGSDFTKLLRLRTDDGTNLNLLDLSHYAPDDPTKNNPFTASHADKFAAGSAMITAESTTDGFQLRDGVTGAVVPDTYYKVSLIDDEPSTSTSSLKVPNFKPGNAYKELQAPIISPEGYPAYDTDKNNRLVIYSTGTYSNASVTLEGWIAFLPFPAFIAEKNVEISGNSEISGAYGAIHSNQNLITGNGGGNNWHVEQTATASGQLEGNFDGHVGGFYGGGQAKFDIPKFVTTDPVTTGGPATSPRLQDFLIRKADVVLIDPSYADGAHGQFANGDSATGTKRLTSLAERLNVPYALLAAALDSDNNSGNSVQQSSAVAVTIARLSDGTGVPAKVANMSTIGWSYGNASNPWNIANNSANGHTVYVVGADNYNLANPSSSTPNGGNVKLTGNIGSNGNPLHVTILATGSIDVVGNPSMAANLTNLQTPMLPPFVQIDALMFAVEDIKVTGDFTANIEFTGVSFAGEQISLSGNGSINGQVIAKSNSNVNGSLVEGPNGDKDRSTITGSFELTLNDGNSVGRIKLFSWRQIKR